MMTESDSDNGANETNETNETNGVGDSKWVTCPRDDDILLGRGPPMTESIGNVRYRELIQSRRAEFVQAERRKRKSEIALEILAEIQRRKGRFLSSVGSQQRVSLDHELDAWVVIPNKKAIVKIKQSLRTKERTKLPPRRAENESNDLPTVNDLPSNPTLATLSPLTSVIDPFNLSLLTRQMVQPLFVTTPPLLPPLELATLLLRPTVMESTFLPPPVVPIASWLPLLGSSPPSTVAAPLLPVTELVRNASLVPLLDELPQTHATMLPPLLGTTSLVPPLGTAPLLSLFGTAPLLSLFGAATSVSPFGTASLVTPFGAASLVPPLLPSTALLQQAMLGSSQLGTLPATVNPLVASVAHAGLPYSALAPNPYLEGAATLLPSMGSVFPDGLLRQFHINAQTQQQQRALSEQAYLVEVKRQQLAQLLAQQLVQPLVQQLVQPLVQGEAVLQAQSGAPSSHQSPPILRAGPSSSLETVSVAMNVAAMVPIPSRSQPLQDHDPNGTTSIEATGPNRAKRAAASSLERLQKSYKRVVDLCLRTSVPLSSQEDSEDDQDKKPEARTG